MFNIVSMQDVLLNLKHGDQLFKTFDPPRIRKRSTGSRLSIASKEKSDFPIEKLWVLPSHLLVLRRTGLNQELIAYDQVPKLSSNDNDEVKLFQGDSAQVYDIFQVKMSQYEEYIFIVLKTGDVVTWMFRKPEYQWEIMKKHSLCKGRDSQIVSFAYDKQTRMLVWCEKRSPTQFCICKSHLKFPSTSRRTLHNSLGKDHAVPNTSDAGYMSLFEGVKAVLHNCSPMNIYALSNDVFCFMPVSNKPQGLFIFWSNKEEEIVVRMWGDDFNDRSYTASSSDYQTIIKDCISLWITYPSSEYKIQYLACHPSSKELIIVQSDLNVYTLRAKNIGESVAEKGNENNNIIASFLCTLEELQEGKDAFLKQVLKFYPLQRMLLFVLEDGTIMIFEIKGGLFLWKTQTFRSCSPQVWIRIGDFPLAGVWNRSGIWNLRPKPISEQLKDLSANRYSINDDTASTETLQTASEKSTPVYGDRVSIVSDPDFALNVFQKDQQHQRDQNEQQQLLRKPHRRFRIKQGINRSEDLPLRCLFNNLNLWQLNNVSMEIALNLAAKLRELKESNEEVDLSEVFSLIEEIKDPVLLLVIFVNKYFPFSVRRKIDCKLRQFFSNSSKSNGVHTNTTPMMFALQNQMEPDILKILQQYMHIDHNIQKCYSDQVSKKSAITSSNPLPRSPQTTAVQLPSLHHIVGNEFAQLEDVICAGNTSMHTLDKRLCSIMDLHGEEFMGGLLKRIIRKEKLQGTPFKEIDESYINATVSKEIWKLFFNDSQIYSKVCSFLWEESPIMITILVKESQKFQEDENDDNIAAIFFQGILSKTIGFLHLPGSISNKIPIDLELTLDKDRVSVYCSLLAMVNTESAKEQRYDILLNYGMVREAFEVLNSYGRESMAFYSLFYQMLCYLLRTKQLGAFAEKLKFVVPENFKMAEFYNVLSNQSAELGQSPVFVNVNTGIRMGELRPLLEKLL